MFDGLFGHLIHEISWNTATVTSDNPAGEFASYDVIRTFEAYSYENANGAFPESNCRSMDIASAPRDKTIEVGPVETKLHDWLHQKGSYQPLNPEPPFGKCLGGIRLIMCDHAASRVGLTMSKAAFAAIYSTFNLDTTTIPTLAFCRSTSRLRITRDADGAITHLAIVMALPPREEAGNPTLSMTYEGSTGMTYAFLCGYGLAIPKAREGVYGSQPLQIVSTLMSNWQYWANPMLLPFTLAQIYTWRSHHAMRALQRGVSLLENSLGFSMRGVVGSDDLVQMPVEQNQDPKTITKKLHFFLPQASGMEVHAELLGKQIDFLLQTHETVSSELKHKQVGNIDEIPESLKFLRTTVDSMCEDVKIWRDKVHAQVNLLFHLVGQQDSTINRASNKLSIAIARSTKQDSISVSTFTFITALFLPGTFVATVFSMSMFNWQSGGTSDINLGQESQSEIISNKFWIYWAISIPLTLVTLICWYLWFRFATHRYYGSLAELEQEQDATDNAGKALPATDNVEPLPVSRRQTWKKEIRGLLAQTTHQRKAQRQKPEAPQDPVV